MKDFPEDRNEMLKICFGGSSHFLIIYSFVKHKNGENGENLISPTTSKRPPQISASSHGPKIYIAPRVLNRKKKYSTRYLV